MTLYLLVVSLHVIVAVTGIGLCGAIPIVASAGRRADVASPVHARVVASLLTYVQGSMIVMLLTGILLDVVARGTFHSTWWFRGSLALFFFLGFAHRRTRVRLRTGLAATTDSDAAGALRSVTAWGWTMCATVAAITVLMEVKP